MISSVSFGVGVIGNIFAFLVFLSPIPTFRRIVRNRSAEEFKSLPYLCTLLCASLWTYYGLIKPGSFIIVPVNGVGALIEVVYIIIFLKFAPPELRLRTILLAAILNLLLLAAAILITLLAMGQRLRIDTVGVLCVMLTIAMYASPLAAMQQVMATRRVEYLPFLVSLSLFVNGGIWSLYAVLSRDYFVGVPNGIGFILGVAQLALHVIYRNPHLSQSQLLLPHPMDLENEGMITRVNS